MNILTVDNITKSYGVRKIFDGASFFLQEGEKAGIIGINGTGKSTLLKMIAGLEEADDGTVIKANHCLVRYLPQNPEFAPEETVLEAVLRGNRVEENAGTIEADAKSMLTKLGVTEFDQPCGQLSGGQRKRLALVSVLLSPAEILLLDEPTNHLDIAAREWIEEAMEAFDGTLLFVSHDRYFIQRFATRIWELADGTITDYPMGFAQYRAVKAQEKAPQPVKAPEKKRDTRPPRGNRSQQAARRQLTICETGISKLEAECRRLDEEMAAHACDAGELNRLYQEKQEVEARLEQEMARWEELSLQIEE